MEQNPVIQTPEQLRQYLAGLLTKNPTASSPQGWDQFSIKPFNDGKTVLAVQDPGAETTTMHSLWLKKGPSGKFDQFVLIKPDKLEAYLDAEGTVPLTPALKEQIKKINPVGGEQSVEDFLRKNKNIKIFKGNEGEEPRVSVRDLVAKDVVTQGQPEKSWTKGGDVVTLNPPPVQVHTAVNRDGKRIIIAEDQKREARGYLEIALKGGTSTAPGTEVTPENNLTAQGYELKDTYDALGSVRKQYLQLMEIQAANGNSDATIKEAKDVPVVMTAAMKGVNNISMAKPPAPPVELTAPVPVAAEAPTSKPEGMPGANTLQQLVSQNFVSRMGGVQGDDLANRDTNRSLTKLEGLMSQYMSADPANRRMLEDDIIKVFGPDQEIRSNGISNGFKQIAIEYIKDNIDEIKRAEKAGQPPRQIPISKYKEQAAELYKSNDNVEAVKRSLGIRTPGQDSLNNPDPKDELVATGFRPARRLIDTFARAHDFEPPKPWTPDAAAGSEYKPDVAGAGAAAFKV